MTKFGWKVVRKIGKQQYVSVTNHAVVEYDFNKWTRPPNTCGPLCLFKSSRSVPFKSHSLAVPSSEAVRMRVPSGENTAEYT